MSINRQRYSLSFLAPLISIKPKIVLTVNALYSLYTRYDWCVRLFVQTHTLKSLECSAGIAALDSESQSGIVSLKKQHTPERTVVSDNRMVGMVAKIQGNMQLPFLLHILSYVSLVMTFHLVVQEAFVVRSQFENKGRPRSCFKFRLQIQIHLSRCSKLGVRTLKIMAYLLRINKNSVFILSASSFTGFWTINM